jgi:hypothetical protein
MKATFTLFFVIICCATVAQVRNFRVGISANLPVIPTQEVDQQLNMTIPFSTGYSSYYVTAATIRESYESRAGVNVHGSFEIPVSTRFSLKSGLTLSYLRYKQTVAVAQLSNMNFNTGNPNVIVGSPYSAFYGYIIRDADYREGNYRWEDLEPVRLTPSDKIGTTSLIQMQVPVLLGTTFFKNKLNVNAGAVTSFALHASAYKMTYPSTEKVTNTSDFTAVSFGSMISVSYSITSRIAAEISGQHYFSPLYKSDYQSVDKAKLNLFSAGLTYVIRN